MKRKLKKARFLKALTLSIVLILSLSLIITLAIINSLVGDYRAESEAIDKFFVELRENPELTVTFFKPIEGRILADLNVEDKGSTKVFYSQYGIEGLYSFNDQFADVDCFYVDENDDKTKYAYTESLRIGKDSEFYKWFPFEIETLRDLVDHYDDVKSSLDSLPHNPPLTDFNDSSGQRQIRAKSDPEFTISKVFNGKSIVCDLYTVSLR